MPASFKDIFADMLSGKSKRRKLYEQGVLEDSDLTDKEREQFGKKKKKKKNGSMSNNTSVPGPTGALQSALSRMKA